MDKYIKMCMEVRLSVSIYFFQTAKMLEIHRLLRANVKWTLNAQVSRLMGVTW